MTTAIGPGRSALTLLDVEFQRRDDPRDRQDVGRYGYLGTIAQSSKRSGRPLMQSLSLCSRSARITKAQNDRDRSCGPAFWVRSQLLRARCAARKWHVANRWHFKTEALFMRVHDGRSGTSTTPKRHGTVWLILALIASALAFAGCRDHAISSTTRSASFDPTGMDSVEIMDSLKRGSATSAELVDIYSDRIAKFDKAGPKLNSIIGMNPHARALADVLDHERAAGKARGPLHGLPIIVKDSYDVVGMPTTGGSVAFANAYPARNAAVVQRLVGAGAIVLAKANMSELATSAGKFGYSSVLGVTLNPYNLKRSSLSSSSGTASAIAAKFAAFGLGTDSAGSIGNPSSVDGLVGIRPTLGLTSRTGVIPFALSLDVTGSDGDEREGCCAGSNGDGRYRRK